MSDCISEADTVGESIDVSLSVLDDSGERLVVPTGVRSWHLFSEQHVISLNVGVAPDVHNVWLISDTLVVPVVHTGTLMYVVLQLARAGAGLGHVNPATTRSFCIWHSVRSYVKHWLLRREICVVICAAVSTARRSDMSTSMAATPANTFGVTERSKNAMDTVTMDPCPCSDVYGAVHCGIPSTMPAAWN